MNIEDLPEGMSLPDFIGSDLARREIKRRFCHFLKTFTDESDRPVYKDRVKRMCDANKQSLEVSYMHLSNAQPVFGIWVADAPEPILEALNEAAFEVVLRCTPTTRRSTTRCLCASSSSPSRTSCATSARCI